MKPTQAEIDFFMTQAWLQELWEPAVGDWVWCGENGFLGLWIVTPAASEYYPYELSGLDHSGEFGAFEELEEIVGFIKGIACWLPTLSDLLGMIEKVLDGDQREKYSDTWQMTRDRIKGPYCAALLYDDKVYGLGETPTIAAAKLLKKIKEVGVPSD